MGGSSDAGSSISSEDEGKGAQKRQKRKEAEKQAKQGEATTKATAHAAQADAESFQGKRDGQIFLAALPSSVDGETLKKDFAKFGEISRFYFHRESDGSPRGTACIFYKDPQDADKVILLDGIQYKGQAIKVKRRPPRKPGGKQARKQQEQAETEALPEEPVPIPTAAAAVDAKVPGSGILKRTQKHGAKRKVAATTAQTSADGDIGEKAPKAKKVRRRRASSSLTS